jgi:aminomethyltransferase
MLKRTPLFDVHQGHGGRLVEFGGWEMPVQYTGIIEEHLAVRRAAGLFDISHMGEFFVSGEGAAAFLNQHLTNNIRKLEPGRGQYTLMCNGTGCVIDDLYVYQLRAHDYLLIVNASRIEEDYAWLYSRSCRPTAPTPLRLENASDLWGAVAVQGPRVADFIDSCFAGPSSEGKAVGSPTGLVKNEIAAFRFEDETAWVARTGYTGEDGFEVVAPSGIIRAIWGRLVAAGSPFGLLPAGLGARDTLRTEMAYPLYGHELTTVVTPIEAGLGYFVALDRDEDFVGGATLRRQKAEGPSRKLVAFRMQDKAPPPRPHYPILSGSSGGDRIGEVTSGTQSPSLGVGIGLGYVGAAHAVPGTSVAIEIRGRPWPAVIVPKPLYRKPV